MYNSSIIIAAMVSLVTELFLQAVKILFAQHCEASDAIMSG